MKQGTGPIGAAPSESDPCQENRMLSLDRLCKIYVSEYCNTTSFSVALCIVHRRRIKGVLTAWQCVKMGHIA